MVEQNSVFVVWKFFYIREKIVSIKTHTEPVWEWGFFPDVESAVAKIRAVVPQAVLPDSYRRSPTRYTVRELHAGDKVKTRQVEPVGDVFDVEASLAVDLLNLAPRPLVTDTEQEMAVGVHARVNNRAVGKIHLPRDERFKLLNSKPGDIMKETSLPLRCSAAHPSMVFARGTRPSQYCKVCFPGNSMYTDPLVCVDVVDLSFDPVLFR